MRTRRVAEIRRSARLLLRRRCSCHDRRRDHHPRVLRRDRRRSHCPLPAARHQRRRPGRRRVRGAGRGGCERVGRSLPLRGTVGRGDRVTANGRPTAIGKVFLIGAGPGDPSLLTLRAAELIASADVVATDALVAPEIVARTPKTAELIYVGKRSGAHSVPQDQTNRILIEKAKQGKRVVRLKGGDPFVFGRGGEEAEELAAAGVEFEIVPGISSSIAGPAYAGIPVTHRSHATSVTLVTGHESAESTGIQWGALAQLEGTIVFMMGLANLPLIARKLQEHGVPGARRVAVVSHATRPEQRTVAGTLEDIEARVAEAKIEPPALIVVGEVVRLHDSINWFESKPLFG